MPIKLTSNAFKESGMIPQKYTGNGDDVSPQLQWDLLPEGTKSVVIICNDPDAVSGNWVHWVVYDIPAGIRELQENAPLKKVLDNGAKQGVNDSRGVGYSGPYPPSGIHRYIFKIFALDTVLNMPGGATEQQVLKAMKGHVLDEGTLLGRYGR